MASGFRADAGIVVRTPLLPLAIMDAWAVANDPRAYLAELIERPVVREALYLASPSLSSAIATWRATPNSPSGRRAEHALVKYVARMIARATPFGLFAGVSAGRLDRATELVLSPIGDYRRSTRLDNDYLFALADELARTPAATTRLVYRPTSGLYRLAGRLRFAAVRLTATQRTYELVSLEPTPYLDATLAAAARGATRAQLAARLVGDDVTLAEASAYIDELVDAQLLEPALGVVVTGGEPLAALIAQLGAAGLDEPRAILEDVQVKLAALDADGVGVDPDRYEAIARALEMLPAKVHRTRLFQVDLIKPATATLARSTVAKLAHVIEQLARITPRSAGTLEAWKRSFVERYEDRTIALAEALDEESGLGFERARGLGSEGSPLLAGLVISPPPTDGLTRWTSFETHMLARVQQAIASATDIELGDADLAAMAQRDECDLPDAFAVQCRLGASTIVLESASGPPGARLTARFAHASPEIAAAVRAHLAAEEALRPAAVFAEIVHLPDGRVGNLACRPVLRAHELVYVGRSGAAEDAQLRIDDLHVAVRADRVVLTSARLGAEVVPRLTSAHDMGGRGLGVYRFLRALALDGVDGVQWSWGALAAAPYLPRVRIGDVIVSRACWRLSRDELATLRAARGETSVGRAVAALRAARTLPQRVAIVDGERELPIDLDNPLLVAAFADEVADLDAVTLVELVVGDLVRGPDGNYANEVVVTCVRQRPPSPAYLPVAVPAIRRTFTPGSEWQYAKIYCGEATADRVLRDAIAPIVRGQTWFFIRYADPDPHLRVRVLGHVAFDAALAQLVDNGVVQRWSIDTYERELERYGGDAGMELVEQLFHADSEAVLGIVELLEGAAGMAARWKLALRGVDTLLELLGIDDRGAFARAARDALGREFGATPETWSQIGVRFTRDRAELEQLVSRGPIDPDHELAPGFEILAERDRTIAPIAAELRRRGVAVADSIAHMHVNRLLHASQRAQEMVIYDLLRRLYRR